MKSSAVSGRSLVPHCLFCFLLQSVVEYLMDMDQQNDFTEKPLHQFLLVVSRVMRKFDLALAEIYFRGRVHAPWLPSSGQGAKGQGRRYAARLALDAL